MAFFTWNLLVVTYLACCQWHCEADVYHVGLLAYDEGKVERFAGLPMALDKYLADHANNTILSKEMFVWVYEFYTW